MHSGSPVNGNGFEQRRLLWPRDAAETAIKDLFCPVLYHQAGQDQWVPSQDVDRLRAAAG